ncbi:MAG: DUF1232 domain-containing protein [Alistipes sp.]|nr:DUF1232 domain-containing protein [Alistipes sp.]
MVSENRVPQNIEKYQKHYSESKFWRKTKSLGKKVLKPALTLYYVMKSPSTPLSAKIKIAGALGYLILPLDLLPDFIPLAGYTDDLAALIALVKSCMSYITPEIEAQVDAKLGE